MNLKGEKIVLREKRLEDAPDDYRWRTDPELATLDGTSPLKASYEEYLESYTEELHYPFFSSRRFSIVTQDARHIGNCMYYDHNALRRQAEVGIMIGDRKYWSEGYGCDAMATLLDHVFSVVRLRKAYLHTLEWNERARRCFRKCGFREVKTVRRGRHTFVRMEIGRAEWEKMRQDKQASGDRDEGVVSAPSGPSPRLPDRLESGGDAP